MSINKYETKRWKKSKSQHYCEDVPADECLGGTKFWCINGINYSQDDLLTTSRKLKLAIL